MSGDAGSRDAGNRDAGAVEAGRLLLRVERGDPSPEELAALTAVVALVVARSASAATSPVVRRSAWSDPASNVRQTHPHGPGAWRRHALPR